MVAGLSTEFWLEAETDEEAPPIPGRCHRSGSSGRCMRASAATDSMTEFVEPAGQWARVPDVYQFTLNGRITNRLLIPRVLRTLERSRVDSDAHLSFEARIEAGDRLTEDEVASIEAPLLGEEYDRLQQRRREFLRRLRDQEHRALVAVADWTPDLARAARAYATAFRDALANASPGLRRSCCNSTHFASRSRIRGQPRQPFVMPTHPLRLLWYSAYCELLRHWEPDLATLDRPEDRGFLTWTFLSEWLR